MFRLEQHYEMYSDPIYQFLYFITFDVQLSEDLMQETFIRAHEAKHTYRGEANILTWLRTIAKNIAYDHFKRKKIITFLPFTKNDAETAVTLSAEQLLSIEEEKRELYQAIANLKLEHRLAIILRKIEGLSIKETATILGWNEAKVKNNTERGMKALESLMKGEVKMDKELQQLQAPKRSNEIRQLSYTTIQTKIAQRKKRQNIHYYSIVMAAAVLFMLLATSFFNNNTELVVNEQTATSPLTIEKGYITTNESTEDLMHMTKWYYFDKNKVSNYDLAIIQPIIEKLYASSQQLESFPQAPQEQLLLVMSDGRVTQLSLLNDQVNNQYLLVDVNTKQVLKLTMDESMDITAIYLDSGNKLLLFIVELFFILLLVILYVNTVLKISPQKKEKLALKHTKYYFLAGIGTYIVYSIVSGFSLYYFHSYNGLFIASVMASLLLAKTLIEYYNGRFDRSILEVPIFFIFILLFTFVKLL